MSSDRPVVFISHHHDDLALADEFAAMLRGATGGYIEVFRSADIKYGMGWFKEILDKITSARTCVCLLTKSSIERPWVLFEAGLAKRDTERDAFGVLFDITHQDLMANPFSELQNAVCDEDGLVRLINQIASHCPQLEPLERSVRREVREFLATKDELVGRTTDRDTSNTVVALFEALKQIPEWIEASIGRRLDAVRDAAGRSLVPVGYPNHESAQPHILDAVRRRVLENSGRRTTVRVLGVSQRFSWPMMRESLYGLLETVPTANVAVELFVVEPEFLRTLGLGEWAGTAEATVADVGNFVRANPPPAGLAQLRLYVYRNLPQWHGVLVGDADLFLGRSDWEFDDAKPDGDQTRFVFKVGQNKYRHYHAADDYGGPERIRLFQNWVRYYRATGRRAFAYPEVEDADAPETD